MKRLPKDIITPEGGEPLYLEDGSGLWLTGPDFALRNDCIIDEIKEALYGGRRASTDNEEIGY